MNKNYSQPTQEEFDTLLEQHQERMQDESGSYPSNERLGFTCVNFSELDLYGKDLRGVIFNRCVLGGDISKANFSGTAVVNCIFLSAILEGCDFENTILTNATFEGCKLTEARFTRARGGRNSFKHCNMNFADCQYAKFKKSYFDHCDMSDCDMAYADLRKSIFESCETAGLCLCMADHEKAEFYKTNILWVNDSMPWSNICINAKSMSIGDRCGTHDEWFSGSTPEIESYQDPLGCPVFIYSDWERWKPALKLMCEQVRIGLFNPSREVKTDHACAVT